MTDFPITPRVARGPMVFMFSHYIAAALTAAATKWEWICPYYATIRDVICDSETAGQTGGTSDIIDVNKNGTTIFTTQGNRPTLLLGDTGMFTRGYPNVTALSPGDILSFDVDQICTTGSARFKIAIVCVRH